MKRLAATDRILVRMPSWVGDFVAAEPLVRTLYENAAEAGAAERLTLAGPAALMTLLEERFPRLERLVVQRGEEGRGWRGHDWALLLNGSFRSAWAAWRAAIPHRVGWSSGGRGPLLSVPLTPARERGRAAFGIGRAPVWPRALPRPFDGVVAELAAAVGVPIVRRHPLLIPTADASWRVQRRLRVQGYEPEQPFVLVNVGARADSSKALPGESWAALLRGVRERGMELPMMLVTGPGEEQRALDVLDLARLPKLHAWVEPAPALPELIALCAEAHAVLCTDGGVRHVARAVRAPTLVLFGPTDPRHTADHCGRERHVRMEVECGPCHQEICPLEGRAAHACMLGLDLEEASLVACERIEEGGRIRALR